MLHQRQLRDHPSIRIMNQIHWTNISSHEQEISASESSPPTKTNRASQQDITCYSTAQQPPNNHIISESPECWGRIRFARSEEITRSVCIIAHVDHGKTTAADALLSKSGKIQSSKAGETLLLDSGKAEAERGITISAKNVTLRFPGVATTTNWHVSNLPFDVTLEELCRAMPRSGGMELAEIHPKRGYGYVALTNIDPMKEKIVIRDRILQFEPMERSEEEKGIFVRDLKLNLVDSPGHAEFSAQVSSSLRISDGAILIVDVIEGVCISTETLLRNACKQGVVPILLLNKADRLFLELELDPQEAMKRMLAVIDMVNSILASEGSPISFDLNSNRVLLTSGYLGWGISMPSLIQFTGTKTGLAALKELAKIHKSAKKGNLGVFKTTIGELLSHPRVSQQARETVERYLGESDFEEARGGALHLQATYKKHLKKTLSLLLPMAAAMLDSIIVNLPSPFVAARMRQDALFGPRGDEEVDESIETVRTAVSGCSKDGPLVAHIIKGIALPSSSVTEIGWVTRVFSGTLHSNQIVRVMFDDSSECSAKVGQILLFDGKQAESVSEICAGDVGIVLMKLSQSATTSSRSNQMLIVQPESSLQIEKYPFEPIPHQAHSSVSAALRFTSQVNVSRLQRKLLDALETLSKLDPAMSFAIDVETKETIISGSGELHLEVLLDSIREMIDGGMNTSSTSPLIVLGEPIVSLRETATAQGSKPKFAKSTNKLNNVSVIALPLSLSTTTSSALTEEECEERLCELESAPDFKSKCAVLSERFGWSSTEIKKIWAFGPEQSLANEGTCILMNSTVGMQNIGDIQGSSIDAFQRFTSRGILGCDINDGKTGASASSSQARSHAKLRGVLFRIVDAKVHSDSAHRRPQQIEPMVGEALRESFLDTAPVSVEPMYSATITCGMSSLKQVQKVLSSRAASIISVGQIVSSIDDESTSTATTNDLVKVEATITISKSFGLVRELEMSTPSGTARKPLVSYTKGGWAIVKN